VQKKLQIPKIIHQTYTSKNLPPEIKHNIERIKNMNPDWEHHLYDDQDIQNYLLKTAPWAISYFNRITPNYGAVKADFFRYILMYQQGGVYLDIKSTLKHPLNQVLNSDDQFLLSHWQNGPGEQFEGWGHHSEVDLPRGEYQQWHIVTIAKHPFLKKVIDDICNNFEKYNPYRDGVGKDGVLRLTGPIPYTLSIKHQLETSQYRLVDAKDDLGFVYSFLDNDLSHKKQLFKKHYSKQKHPILKSTKIN